MTAQIPLRDTEPINFGDTVVHTDNEILSLYEVMCYNDNAYIGTSTHKLYKMVVAVRAAIAAVRDESYVLTAAGVSNTVTDIICMMNLGRLAKEFYEGDDLVAKIKNIYNELCKDINGTVISTKTIAQLYVPIAIMVAGKKMTGFIGETNATKYRPADDITAGYQIVMCYIMTLHTGDYMTRKFLADKIVQKKAIDGVIHASFQPVIAADESTWGSLLVNQENYDTKALDKEDWETTGVDLFGVNTDLIDSPLLRGVSVSIYKHCVPKWQKLLSKTRWIWKFGRWMEVQPLYFIWNPETDEDGAIHEDWEEMLSDGLSDGTNHKFRIWNQMVNEMVSEFKNTYMPKRMSSFIKNKSLFEYVNWSDIPPLGNIGPGGILFHQCAHFEDGGESTDVFCSKFIEDETTNTNHNVLTIRRSSSTNYKFMIIGDVDLHDYRLVVGAGINATAIDGAAATLSYVNNWLVPKSMFGFSITKSEDTPYKISRYIKDVVAPATMDNSFTTHGDNLIPKTWVDTADGWTIGSEFVKSDYYACRGEDPYKKLEHKVYDINHLDVDFIMADQADFFFPSTSVEAAMPQVSATIEASPIVVSALPMQPGLEPVIGDPNSQEKQLEAHEMSA